MLETMEIDGITTYKEDLKDIVEDKGKKLKQAIDNKNNEIKEISDKVENKEDLKKSNKELEEDIEIIEIAIQKLNTEDKENICKT